MKPKEIRDIINNNKLNDDEEVEVFLTDGPDGWLVKYGMKILGVNTDDKPIMIFVDNQTGEC